MYVQLPQRMPVFWRDPGPAVVFTATTIVATATSTAALAVFTAVLFAFLAFTVVFYGSVTDAEEHAFIVFSHVGTDENLLTVEHGDANGVDIRDPYILVAATGTDGLAGEVLPYATEVFDDEAVPTAPEDLS
jgi:hypothetical protein